MTKDERLADDIEKLWGEIGDKSWSYDYSISGPTVLVTFRGPDGRPVGGFDLTDCPNAYRRAELIVKTMNTLPRIIEILRRPA